MSIELSRRVGVLMTLPPIADWDSPKRYEFALDVEAAADLEALHPWEQAAILEAETHRDRGMKPSRSVRYAEGQARDDHGRFAGDGQTFDPLTSKTVSDFATLATQMASRGSYKAGDLLATSLAHELGLDGKPKIVGTAEMDKMVAAGADPIYRGVAAERHALDTMTGDQPRYPLGQNGSGLYFAGGDGGRYEAIGYATNSPLADEEFVMRGVLDPSAKIISIEDAIRGARTASDAARGQAMGVSGQRAIDLSKVLDDPGRWAMTQGYDAIKADMGFGYNIYYAVLNRSMLTIQRENDMHRKDIGQRQPQPSSRYAPDQPRDHGRFATTEGADLDTLLKPLYGLEDHVRDAKRAAVTALADSLGLGGKPQVMSRDGIDSKVAAGWTEMWRGIEGAQYTRSFRTGDAYWSLGAYGSGMYSASNRGAAEGFGGKESRVVRMALDPAANVVDYEPAMDQFVKWVNTPDKPERENADVGMWAMANGYDAIRAPIVGGSPIYLLLNRGMLAVEDKDRTRAFRQPEVRYAPDQPRDDHGRWSATGEATKVDDAIAKFRDKHGDTVIPLTPQADLDSMGIKMTPEQWQSVMGFDKPVPKMGPGWQRADEELAVRTITQFDRLQTDFPQIGLATADVRDLGPMLKGQKGQGDTLALTVNDAIYFNEVYYDASGLLVGDADQPDTGFHPAGTNTPEGTATHEFGHVVDNLMLQLEQKDKSPEAHEAAQQYREWRNEYAFGRGAKRLWNSGYARQEGGLEAVAEAFSAAFSPGSKATYDPGAIQIKGLLSKYGIYRGEGSSEAAAAWTPYDLSPKVIKLGRQVRYSEDQTRDDHGRFADEGKGGDGAGIVRRPFDPATSEAVRAGIANVAYSYGSAYGYVNMSGFVAEIAHEAGYDGPAHLGTAAEIDAAIARGEQPLYRGVGEPGYAEDLLKNGPYRITDGMSGAGTYFATKMGMALTYSSPTHDESEQTDGVVIRATLLPGAKVVDHDEALRATAAEWKERTAQRKPDGMLSEEPVPVRMADALNHISIWAIEHGYDAIRRTRMGAIPIEELCVLNRTALRIQSIAIPAASAVSRAPSVATRYAEGQARDDHGRFADEGKGGLRHPDDFQDPWAKGTGWLPKGADVGQVESTLLAHVVGFDGPAKVVPTAEMDRLIAEGAKPWYRGVTNPAFLDTLRDGFLRIPPGIYGSGLYFAPNASGAANYASNARGGWSGQVGAVARVTLAPDANVVAHDDLLREMADARTDYAAKTEADPHYSDFERGLMKQAGMSEEDYGRSMWQNNRQKVLDNVFRDEGTYAIARGYDAIDLGHISTADPDKYGGVSWTPYLTVLNRAKLIVDEGQQRYQSNKKIDGPDWVEPVREAPKRAVRYSEDQPRVPAGSPGGGEFAGGDMAVPEFKTALAGARWISKNVGVKIKLKGDIDVRLLRSVGVALQRLKAHDPSLFSGKVGTKWGTDWPPLSLYVGGSIQYHGYSEPMAGLAQYMGDNTIGLNSFWWETQDQEKVDAYVAKYGGSSEHALLQSERDSFKTGWAFGDPTWTQDQIVGSILAHEMGHAVEFFNGSAGRGGDAGQFDQSVDELAKIARDNPVSRYASTGFANGEDPAAKGSDSSILHESFAEAYSASYHGAKDPASVAIREWIVAGQPPAWSSWGGHGKTDLQLKLDADKAQWLVDEKARIEGRAVRYSQDQARDEAGRFADEGKGEGKGGEREWAARPWAGVDSKTVQRVYEGKLVPTTGLASGATVDRVATSIAIEIGATKKALRCSTEEMDRREAAGETILFRGSAEMSHIEQMAAGRLRLSLGSYGSGYYFAASGAGMDLGPNTLGANAAHAYSDHGVVVRATLRDGARVLDLNDGIAQMKAASDRIYDHKQREIETGDVGRWALTHGYDAVRSSPMGSPLAFYSVVNRGALVIEDKPIPDETFSAKYQMGSRSVPAARYAPDQERDDHGRFASEGGSGAIDLVSSGIAAKCAADESYFRSPGEDPSVGNQFCADVAKARGIDGPPKAATGYEIEDLQQEGWIGGWRGFGGGRGDQEAFVEQFRHGGVRYAQGSFGRGYYLAEAAGPGKGDPAYAEAAMYAMTSKTPERGPEYGPTIRVALPPDAKIIDHTEALQRMGKEIEPVLWGKADEPPVWHATHEDVGNWALANGYDAIRVPKEQVGANGYLVLLNRSIAVVQSDDSRLGVGEFPPRRMPLVVARYAKDQTRDDHGRFATEAGSGDPKPVDLVATGIAEKCLKDDYWGWDRPEGQGGDPTKGNAFCADVARARGIDGPPRLVSGAEIERLAGEGWTIGWHGFTVEDAANQFRAGPVRYGPGTYGRGYYIAEGDTGKAGEPAWYEASIYARQSHTPDAFDKFGPVISVALPPDAKIIDYNDAVLRYEEKPKGGVASETKFAAWQATSTDVGNWALANGYDAMRVTSTMTGRWTDRYLVLLNRSLAVVQSDDSRPVDEKPPVRHPQARYAEDQSRDDHGRFADEGKGTREWAPAKPWLGAESKTVQRIIDGKLGYPKDQTSYGIAKARTDPVAAAVATELGVAGKPLVVSPEEIDAAAANGQPVLFRGSPDGKYIEQLRTGALRMSLGLHGSGYYFASGDTQAKGEGLALRYSKDETLAFAPGSSVVRAALREGARVIDREDALNGMFSTRDQYASDPNRDRRTAIAREIETSDLGRWALIHGYDAISSPVQISNWATTDSAGVAHFYTVVNRGALMVENVTRPAKEEDERLYQATMKPKRSVRYAPDQARDDHGRFADEGGGTATPEAGTPHVDAAVDAVRAAISNLGVKGSPTSAPALIPDPLRGRRITADLAEKMGVDGKPRIVTSDELDALVQKDGWTPMFRGLGNGKYTEQFRSGPAYWSPGGYGDGLYASDDYAGARIYVEPKATDGLMRMALAPDAKVIDWKEALTIREGYPDSGGDRYINEGTLAMALGYDAMYVQKAYTGTEQGFWVVLNRTKVAVEDHDLDPSQTAPDYGHWSNVLAPTTRYAPDQPRDDHGRFSGNGGSAQASGPDTGVTDVKAWPDAIASPADIKAASDRLAALGVSWRKGQDWEHWNKNDADLIPSAYVLDRVASGFERVASVAPALVSGAQLGIQPFRAEFAVYDSNGTINLAADLVEDRDDLGHPTAGSIRLSQETGHFFASPGHDVDMVVAHELGHFWAEEYPRTAQNLIDTYQDHVGMPQIDKYSQRNSDEWLASHFAATLYLDQSKWTPAVYAMAAAIKAPGAPQPGGMIEGGANAKYWRDRGSRQPVRRYREDQTRDDHGRFAYEGGGPGSARFKDDPLAVAKQVTAKTDAVPLKELLGSYRNGSYHDADTAMGQIVALQGFGKPDLITKDQLAKYEAAGELHWYRGFGGGTLKEARDENGGLMVEPSPWGGTQIKFESYDPGPVPAMIAQMAIGDFHPGRGGYGEGIYVAVGDDSNGLSAREEAHNFADPGMIAEGTIKADARIIDYRDLYKQMLDTVPGLKESPFYGHDVEQLTEGPREHVLLSDPARFAAAAGYDIIQVLDRSRSGASDGPQYVILNRGAIRMVPEGVATWP